MDNYSKFISEKRKSVSAPNKLVENGQAIFGTFDKEINHLNLLDCINPLGKGVPHFINKLKLTAWEAMEIVFDEGVLVTAVYNMGLLGFSIFVFFDKRTKKVYRWVNNVPGCYAKVAPNLINSVTEQYTKNSVLKFINQFQEGKCSVKGNASNKKFGKIQFEIDLSRISLPSTICIPFGKNKPLYSQKDFFQANGYLMINGETIRTKDNTTAIIDDHKGYYPYRAHYDWLTTMGKINVDGENIFIAINLTKNQSIDEYNYNENILWMENNTSILPPVKFYADGNKWIVKDEFDMVNITFEIDNFYTMQIHLGLVDIDYTLPFGKVFGYVRDISGNKFILDNMTGIGEDKSTRI